MHTVLIVNGLLTELLSYVKVPRGLWQLHLQEDGSLQHEERFANACTRPES